MNRPVTRSLSSKPNKLPPEPGTMGDQNMLAELKSLLQEAISESEARMEAKLQNLTQQLEIIFQPQISSRDKGSGGNEVGNSKTGHSSLMLESPIEKGMRPCYGDNSHDTGGSNGGGMIPRYTKLDFPTYNGSEDPLIWLHRCEQFFDNQRTMAAEKVSLAAFHMLGEAHLWYYKLKQEEPDITWAKFSEYCTFRFGPPLRSNSLGDLVNLKQTGSVDEYQRQFQSLLARAISDRCDQQVDLFTAGLVESIRLDVEMHHHINLAQAMSLARAFEKRQQIPTSIRRNYGATFNVVSKTNNPVHQAQKSTIQGDTTSAGYSSASSPFIKKLSRSKMAERRAKGLC